MSTARSRRLALLAVALGALLILPASAFAGSANRTLQGTLVAAHGDSFGANAAASRSIWHDTLVTASGKVSLSFSGARPEGFYNGAKVRVRGTMSGNTLKVGGNKADAQVQTVAAASTGQKKLAVLLIKFADTDPEPYTVSQAQQVIFSNANSVANYFADESYGLMTVTGDVFGYFTISINTAGCDYTDIGNKARAAATAAGVNLGNYTQIQYVHNYLSACGWSGLAYVPGQDSWLNQALGLRVSAHELSHNFGVHHASTMSCTENGVRVALSASSANCSSSEYGDPFSIMGAASTRHTHNQQLASMGWITGGNLQTITTAGTYTVGAVEDPNMATPRGVRIPRGNTGTWFYLEVREPWGTQFDNFSASDPAVTGVSIRLSNDWTTIIQSQLLDTTPATSSYGDAPLQPGRSFSDPLSGVTITTQSVSGGVATVTVSWGADATPPSTPSNLAVTSTGATTARLTWTASTDNIGVAGYWVTRNGGAATSVTTTQFNDTGLAGGASYTYTVQAYDASGNASGVASRAWTQPIADTTPPSSVSITGSATKAKVSLSWAAATDAGGSGLAGYHVYRNGVLVATTTARTWSEPVKKGTTVYTVKAFDGSGNVGLAANSYTTTK
jgi:chitodextrinase